MQTPDRSAVTLAPLSVTTRTPRFISWIPVTALSAKICPPPSRMAWARARRYFSGWKRRLGRIAQGWGAFEAFQRHAVGVLDGRADPVGGVEFLGLLLPGLVTVHLHRGKG